MVVQLSGFLTNNAPAEMVEGKCACDTCSHMVSAWREYSATKGRYLSRWCSLASHRLLETGYNCKDYNYEVGTDDEEPVPWEKRFPQPRKPLK